MRNVTCWVAALLLPALLPGPLFGAAKKKVNKDLDKPTTKMVRAGQLIGKIVNVYEAKKTIRIQVQIPYIKLNTGAYNGLVRARLDYNNAYYKGDYNGMRTAQMQMLQHQNNLYTIEYTPKEYELTAIDDVVVRAARPRVEFNERGKPKKLTRKELRALKGNPRLPGYKAEFSDVQQDQVVQVNLVRKKGALARPVRRKRGKRADKEAVDPLEENLPKVSMIVILREPESK
jgi:hypothetical protein